MLSDSEDFFEGQSNYEKRLKPILNLWKKLNEVFILFKQKLITSAYLNEFKIFQGISLVQSTDTPEPNIHITDPWCAFVLSEMNLAKSIFKTIHQMLVVMHGATKDITSVGKEDMTLIKIICENQVPLKWRQLWSGPRFLTDYLKAIVSRGVEAHHRFNSEKHIEFGDKIDFAKVYNVESFLAALKLRNARFDVTLQIQYDSIEFLI